MPHTHKPQQCLKNQLVHQPLSSSDFNDSKNVSLEIHLAMSAELYKTAQIWKQSQMQPGEIRLWTLIPGGIVPMSLSIVTG